MDVDKYENKVKIEEIRNLIYDGAFEEAADIAGTIDWNTVKNITTLGMVSDLYKKLRMFEESRNILLIAYERQRSKPIVKSLCEVSLKLGDLMNALEYFNEFQEIAPNDPGVYILQYQLFKSQHVNYEEQIEVLEKLKEVDYRARWAYELATLYHNVGMESKCIEECNEMILWFVDGKYVLKAYELKAQHKPLTEAETYKYEVLRQAGGTFNIECSLKEEEPVVKEEKEFAVGQDVSAYNTQNLQSLVAEGLQDVLDNGAPGVESVPSSQEEAIALDEAALNEEAPSEDDGNDLLVTQMYNPVIPEAPVGQDLEEAFSEEFSGNDANRSDTDIIGHEANQAAANILGNSIENNEPTIVLNQNTDEIKPITGQLPPVDTGTFKPLDRDIPSVDPASVLASEINVVNPKDAINNTGIIETFHKGSNYDDMLTQGYDGQISLVIPEEHAVEKQITGQLSIADVMQEWERKKKETDAKMIADVRAKVHDQASSLLADFDESTKSSLMSQIENAMISAALSQDNQVKKPKLVKCTEVGVVESEEELKARKAKEIAAKKAKEAEEMALEAIAKAEEEEKAIEKAKKPEVIESEPEEDGVEEIEEIEDTSSVDEEVSDEEAIDDVEDIEDAPEEVDDEETASDDEDEEAELSDDESDEADSEDEDEPVEEETQEEHSPRELTPTEMDIFGAFVHNRKTQKQLADVLDNFSLASCTGNILVSYEEDNEVTTFSKLLIKEIQLCDSNFTGKVAAISGESLNRKDIADTLSKVSNGALIITDPEKIKDKTLDTLLQELSKDGNGVVIIIQGHVDDIDDIVDNNPEFAETFNLRVDLKSFDNRTLVEYGRSYAYSQEYSIDEFGILALHNRIEERQTANHEVTMAEIEELIDEAIYYADKKTPAHFFDVLFGKRYDGEDMIILREKDFMHN